MPTEHFGFSDVDTSAPLAYNPLFQLQTFKTEVDDALYAVAPTGASLADPAANGIVVRTSVGVTVARSLTQPAAGLAISNNDGVSGNPTFALANDLAALEGLSGTGIAKRTGSDTWSVGSLVSGDIPDLSGTYLTRANNLSDLANAGTARTNLGVAIGSNVQAWDADLDAIAALAGTSGLLQKTGANTWALDTSTYATQAYANSLVVGLLDDRGNYDASGNTFPASGGSGSAGAILKGDLWTISVAGTLGGHPVTAGDVVRALADTPGQTDANWAIGENNFGYVALNQALADGKIYVGNGSGIGTAVTPSGDVTITNAGVTAIGALKVTNGMLAGSIAYSKLSLTGAILNADLAGSIAASKLVGTDIATVGTLTAGATGAGFTVALSTSTITGTLADARLSANVAFRNAANSFAGHQTPSLTDTYDLGSSTLLWRKGYLSELDAVLFAQNTVSVIGGWLLIAKGEGTVDEDVDTSETQIDFGTNNISANDFIIFRAAGAVEYMQATSLVSGNNWNVTRNVDGSGANAWPQGSVWVNLGYNGTGRIELNASDTPRISMLTQGTSYNSQTELLRIGDLNGGWGYSSTEYGFAVGDFVAGSYLTVDDGGMTIKAGAGNVTLSPNGLTIAQGLTSTNAITWLDVSAPVAKVFGWGNGNDGTLFLVGKAKTSAGLNNVFIQDESGGPRFQLTIGGSTHATLPDQGYALLGTGTSVPLIGFSISNTSTVVPTSLLHLNLRDAATNVLSDVVLINHSSTGTIAANFGSSLLFKLTSATVNNRDAARLGALWTTATDASRTSAFVIQTVNNAGSLAEVARFAGNGDATFTGLLKVGSGPTTHTDAAGKILSAALNTVAVANGGTGSTTASGARTNLALSSADAVQFAALGVGVTPRSTGADIGSYLRVTGSSGGAGSPTAGAGMELYYNTAAGQASMQAYDRDAAAYKEFFFESSGMYINKFSDKNIGLRTSDQFGSGVGVIGIKNATTDPTTNPTGGGVLFASGGAGKWRGSSGTVTTFGPAEPHCPRCGTDFAIAVFENAAYGKTAACFVCLKRALARRGIDPMEYMITDEGMVN